MNNQHNILYKADQIVNHRAEEKERQYGPFAESIERTAAFYNLMKPKNDPDITPEGVLRVLISLKLSREAYGHKEDNLLDGVAYIGALHNYIEEKIENKETEENKYVKKIFEQTYSKYPQYDFIGNK